jgi:hypothetical protein
LEESRSIPAHRVFLQDGRPAETYGHSPVRVLIN